MFSKHAYPPNPGLAAGLYGNQHGRRGRGRKKDTYVNMLIKDTGLDNASDLCCVMQDRTSWKRFVHESRVGIG